MSFEIVRRRYHDRLVSGSNRLGLNKHRKSRYHSQLLPPIINLQFSFVTDHYNYKDF